MKNFYILLLLPLLLFSCKKEYPQLPYAELLQFIIKDAKGTELKAVIKGEEILVYWPPLQDVPDSISPMAAVSERANILPESGKKVPFKDGTIYTVTAQNGSTKQYKLKLALNQLKPYLSLATTALAGASFSVSGDFFIPDTARTKVFFTDSKGKDIQLKNVFSINQINIWYFLPEMEEGIYKVKMISGIHTITAKDPVTITYSASPRIDRSLIPYPTALQRNAEYQYRIVGTPVSKLTKIRMRLLSDNTLHEVELRSRNLDNTVTLKIPAAMPLGTYTAFELSSSILTTPFISNLSSAYRIMVSE